MKLEFQKLLFMICLLILPPTVFAADTGGEIRGQVTDQSGAGIPSAVVTMVHADKGVKRTTLTGSDGQYALRNLPVGNYTLTVSSDEHEEIESQVGVKVGKPLVVSNVLKSESDPRGDLEELVVVGTTIQGLNMSETTAGAVFDDSVMDVMPVDNGFESMVLMTPGTVANGANQGGATGDGVFQGANSIGGGSPAENAYYLNGINITQIESGLGSFRMPWEAIQQTSVQTGGITADLGGALGGVVNSVSKSGTNEFDFGLEVKFEPSSTWESVPTVRRVSDPSVLHKNHQQDSQSFEEYNIWASGPIVKDKAFFYLLFNPQKEVFENADNSTFESNVRKSDRWFANLEWYVSDRHSIGLTSFNTERELTVDNFDYDRETNTVTDFTGNTYFKDGGTFLGLNYHGELTDTLSLDLVYGETEEEAIPQPASELVLVEDCRVVGGRCSNVSNHSDSTLTPKEFSREQFRVDFNWDLGDHQVAFGYDQYEIDVFVNQRPNGVSSIEFDDTATDNTGDSIGWWVYGIGGEGRDGRRAVRNGVPVGQEFISRRVRNRFSDSTVSSKAFYVQDSWAVNDVFTMNLGLRLVDFESTISSGEAYADLDGNLAPRIAGVWDINGEGRNKVTASFGRYFQPVAARMNITQGSSSIEYYDHYLVPNPGGATQLQTDGSPVRAERIGDREYTQRGFTDPNLIASKNLEAMYSDQISLGFSRELDSGMTFGVRGTYNELKRSVEDTDYGPVLVPKLAELGINDALGQSSFYVLSNPGEDIELAFDFDQDGTVDSVTLTPEDHLIPKATRKYLSMDFTYGGQLTDRINLDASYTWSKSYGNTEGLVKTTNGQADPGWTSDYDYGEVLDHATGNLPNDRRHSIKLNGTYDLTDQFILGLAVRTASGRPLNRLFEHPAGVDSCAPGNPWEACAGSYVNSFYDQNGNPSPRGSAGNLSWTKNVDVSLAYRNEELFGGLLLKLTAFNIFNFDDAIDVAEVDGPDYRLNDFFQNPRRLSFTARMNF